MAAKSEGLVFQSYRSSDNTHSVSSEFDSYSDVHKRPWEENLCRGARHCVLVQNEIKHVILINITAPTEILGRDFGQGPLKLPLVDRRYPYETIAIHASFRLLSLGIWRGCNLTAILRIKAALKDVNLVFHPGRRLFFTEIAYKLWRLPANVECRLRQL